MKSGFWSREAQNVVYPDCNAEPEQRPQKFGADLKYSNFVCRMCFSLFFFLLAILFPSSVINHKRNFYERPNALVVCKTFFPSDTIEPSTKHRSNSCNIFLRSEYDAPFVN